MNRLIINDLFEVVELMYDKVITQDKENVLFVGHYEDAAEVVKLLLMQENVYPYSIELVSTELNRYNKEYYVSLDENLEIICEPAWIEDTYLHDGVADIVFIMNDCNSSILNRISADNKIEVLYECEFFEEENTDCCGECCCGHSRECNNEETILNDPNRSESVRVAVDDNGHIHGFEKSWIVDRDGMHYHHTISHYSNDETNLHKIMNKLGIKKNVINLLAEKIIK